jgi:hypothetical protein
MAFTPAPNNLRYTPQMRAPTVATPSGAPTPPYSGTFIPQIWSAKLVDKFYDATVLAAIANTDYEGEIQSYGDTVNIRTRPDVTIRDYAPDQMLEVERPSSDIVQLLIDQGHYFNTILDDVYRTQSDIDLMNIWAEDASEQMKIRVDTNVLAGFPTFVDTRNAGAAAGRLSGDINLGVTGTPVTVAKSDAGGNTSIVDLIVDMGQVLDEQNVPETGRFLIIPAWVSSLIKKSELRDASLTGDGTSILRNGRLGVIDRFTLFSSNLLPSPGAAQHHIFAGSQMGLTFAAQMTNMETLRSESTFGELMRGLMIYGFEAIKPECLAMAVVAKA